MTLRLQASNSGRKEATADVLAQHAAACARIADAAPWYKPVPAETT
jgi:hypothetical protein